MRLYAVGLFSLATLFVSSGSAAAAGTPVLLDTIGAYQTEVGAEVQPLVKPACSPTYKFVVQFDGFEQNDVVLVQRKLGGMAMGKPNPARPQEEFGTLRSTRRRPWSTGKITNTTVDAKATKKGYFGRVTWAAGCPSGM